MKKIIALLMLLTITAFTAGCGSENTQNNTETVLTPTQMQHDPMSFTGQISVEGVVGGHRTNMFDFSLHCDDFILDIDFRGNQALPQNGATVVVSGQMNYRPCCGPHLVATRFEVVE